MVVLPGADARLLGSCTEPWCRPTCVGAVQLILVSGPPVSGPGPPARDSEHAPRRGRRRAVAGNVADMADASPVVVVTGANGLVGTAVCRALVERSAQVRGVVRRAGSAPALDGVTEHVGEFAGEVTRGADAVVSTVHPMGSSREVQHRVGVEGTLVLARVARDAGVARLVHVSTAGVYDRSAGVGDIAEDGALLPEGSGDYPDTKNATDTALARVGGLTTVLLRPPAVLGPGDTS